MAELQVALTSTNGPAAGGGGGLEDVGEDPAAPAAVQLGGAAAGLGPVEVERVAAAAGKARAASTARAYGSDWDRFSAWCGRRGLSALPATPEVLAADLAEMAKARDEDGARAFSAVTLTRWVAAINAAHRACGEEAPGQSELVKATLSGIRRAYAQAGERPARRRAPLVLADVQQLLEHARTQARSWIQQVTERRDSTLILFGFAGAFRRSELVALTTTDVHLHPQDGLHVRVGKSKTDQEGDGQIKALPYGRSHETCPVCAYVRWRQVLDAWEADGRAGVLKALRQTRAFKTHICHERDSATGLTTGAGRRPVFQGVHKTGAIAPAALTGQAVNFMLTRRATAAGLDPVIVRRLGAHSLRVGFATQAVRAGADSAAIMRQTGHTTEAMVRLYTRENAPLTDNAVTSLGL